MKRIVVYLTIAVLTVLQTGCAVIDKATVYSESNLTVTSRIPGANNAQIASSIATWYASVSKQCPAGTVASTEAGTYTEVYWSNFRRQYAGHASQAFVDQYCVRVDRPPPQYYDNWQDNTYQSRPRRHR